MWVLKTQENLISNTFDTLCISLSQIEKKLWAPKEVKKSGTFWNFTKTLIFLIWRFCYTLRIGCNTKKKYFWWRSFFVIFNISTMCNGNIWSKIPILGPLGPAEKSRPRKYLIFSQTFLTFLSITQLSDVVASKFEFVLLPETKG